MWATAEFADLVGELRRFDLVFDVQLPTTGPVWEQLYEQVMQHLDRVGIALVVRLDVLADAQHRRRLLVVVVRVRAGAPAGRAGGGALAVADREEAVVEVGEHGERVDAPDGHFDHRCGVDFGVGFEDDDGDEAGSGVSSNVEESRSERLTS